MRNCGLWNPVEDDSTEFYLDKFKPMLRDNRKVAEKLVVGADNWDLRHPNNQSSVVKFIGATFYNRYASTAKQYRRIYISTGINDENDAMPWNVEGEGSPDGLLRERTNSAPYPKEINGSTPTLKGSSSIDRLIGKIRVLFERSIPCPKCKTHQVLSWGGANATFGIRFTKYFHKDDTLDVDRTAASTRYQCASCRHLFSYAELRDIDRRGRWVTKEMWLDDESGKFFSNETGEVCDPPVECGLVLNALYSYTVSWEEGVRRYLNAVNMARLGQNEDLITWTNHYLGEAYQSKESQQQHLHFEDLLERRENFGDYLPDGVQFITLWCDVQGDRLELEVIGWGYGYESWVLRYIILDGNPDDTDVLDRLYNLTSAMRFKKENSSELRIGLAGIDSGHKTRLVYNFCENSNVKASKLLFIATKGDGLYGRPVQDFRKVKYDDRKVRLLLIGTEQAKDIVYARYLIQDHGPGFHHIIESVETEEQYCKGKLAEQKLTSYKQGRAVERWTQIRKDYVGNEPFDATVGNFALCQLAESRFNVQFEKPSDQESPIASSPRPIMRVDPASIANSYKAPQ